MAAVMPIENHPISLQSGYVPDYEDALISVWRRKD